MELYDPVLAVAFFYPAGDPGIDHLWQAVTATLPEDESTVRRQRLTLDGAVLVRVSLERRGVWEVTVWQQLAQEIERWLGKMIQTPPGHPWGQSHIYLGAAVAGLYEEQRLLQAALGLPDEPARPVAHLPVGRLWLASPPAMTGGGSTTATYAWIYAPAEGSRQRLEGLLWGEISPLLRSELYLHRALNPLRQYGREERAAFWTTLEQLESAAAAALAQPEEPSAGDALQEACYRAVQGLTHLSRRHNLLRSSAYLYQQIYSNLCSEENTLFTWYKDRLQEALVQWGYDLERADRAIALAQTALLTRARGTLPAAVPPQAAGPAEPTPPARPSESAPLPAPLPPPPAASRPPWAAYVLGAAIVALCLVDDSWLIVLARAGAVLLLGGMAWVWWFLGRRSSWR